MAKQPHKLEPRAFAKVLVEDAGLAVGYASDLANKKAVPSLRLAVRLEQDLKIPLRFWAERIMAEGV